MNGNAILILGVFSLLSSLVLMAVILVHYGGRTVEARLTELTPKSDRVSSLRSASSWLSRLGTILMPVLDSNRERVENRLLQAGFYRHPSIGIFFGIKLLLMLCPVVAGLVLYSVELLTFTQGILFGALVGLVGTLAPGLWLSSLRARRRTRIRRAMPDALDVIVICLEGGLSLPAAFARVSDELHTAYPLLAAEMLIVRKEVELGESTGQAFHELAERFDSDDLRSMAALITQAEQFGASLVRTLRIQADDLRVKRHLYAETQAQKAPLKLIFPTVLCIFPALYIVLMGPAGVQIMQLVENLRR